MGLVDNDFFVGLGNDLLWQYMEVLLLLHKLEPSNDSYLLFSESIRVIQQKEVKNYPCLAPPIPASYLVVPALHLCYLLALAVKITHLQRTCGPPSQSASSNPKPHCAPNPLTTLVLLDSAAILLFSRCGLPHFLCSHILFKEHAPADQLWRNCLLVSWLDKAGLRCSKGSLRDRMLQHYRPLLYNFHY